MDQSEAILKLRCQLKEVEEERSRAAQYGLQLLESQSDLQNQLEEQRCEMTSAIENLEQEKYSLQREVELKSRMQESLLSECESLKQQRKTCLEQLQQQLEMSHNRERSELNNKIEQLKAELDEARLSEKQLKHKVDHQTELLANKSEELRAMSERAHETMTSETLALQLEVNELESSKAQLEEEINELKYRQQQLVLNNGKQSRQLESLKLEKEELEKDAVGYFNAFQRSRDANSELQIQLDSALQKAQDPNRNGNSLFAEVEDRRAEMERKLIGMKVQYQSLQKQHAFSRQQMHRMKVQIATLLQLKGSHIDPEQLERLQSMVAQKNTEVEKLLVKVRQLEKCQSYENGQSKMDIDVLVQGDDVYYVDLLKMKLENSNFLATGETLRSLHFQFRIGVSKLSGIIADTCRALWDNLRDEFLPLPTTEIWEANAKKFEQVCSFPNCIGAVDYKASKKWISCFQLQKIFFHRAHGNCKCGLQVSGCGHWSIWPCK
ncbi:protein Spindly isoform X6 [Ranitomeya imitator]|uniref:protein Spindly isoform X6 n=1 Tax=Ranitomeya imitator TaxID=111125 RepID=UPI0037E7F707